MAAAKTIIIERMGVDVYVPESDVKAPYCQHGPTILFERYLKDKESRRFFACSASRDRKGCPFFQWEDEKLTTGKQLVQKEFRHKLKEENLIVENFYRLRKEAATSEKNLFFCFKCGHAFMEGCIDHSGHNTIKLNKADMKEPSKFLSPAENKKTNAQYFFTESTCSFIIKTLNQLGYEKVISLGVPRIHERIQKLRSQRSIKQQSILLDIDKRYAQFLSPSEFLHYNMFNSYFFGGEAAESRFKEFLAAADPRKIVLVMDPPFGGLMSLLAASLKNLLRCLTDGSKFDSVGIVMVFPYFLESHVTEAFPSLRMTDYKVNYENHPKFKQRLSERGSPIRIFTNVSGEDFVLPENEGYRFCDICKRYVADHNKHCKKCDTCPSKDGRPYIHCELCTKCVKPGRVHCDVCKSCELDDHDCQRKRFDSFTCHICGLVGHKRKDCPEKMKKNLKRKPTSSEKNEVTAPKKSHSKPGKKRKRNGR